MSGDGRTDAERFRQVVLPHLQDALGFARWLTGNPHDAEDVVQEACLRALSGIGGFAGGNAKAWLLAIVRNTASSFMARQHRKGAVPLDDWAETAAVDPAGDASLSGPEASLIAAADAAALEAAIAELPLAFREALVLRDVNGLGYREIAELLAIPVGTVMSRLSRARALLISKLGGTR